METNHKQKTSVLKRALATAALVVFSVIAIALGAFWLRGMALERVNGERRQQLEELTAQISDTFANALAFNRACAGTAANLLAQGEYASAEDISRAAKSMEELVLTDGAERIFVFIDEDGVCHDASGERGIWGDFDQIATADSDYAFIADSVNYDGVHWAFVRRLDTPVTTRDGKVSIRYVVLLRPVEYMSRYYASEAYDDVCETYILKENGTRMYDSVTPEDTISAYNIYKNLRETNSRYGSSFDDTLRELEANGVACGNYESAGTEYCYSLAWQKEYQFVLLFLIPADAVAINTVEMLMFMMWVFVVFGVFILALVVLCVAALQWLMTSRRLAAINEQNLREQELVNYKLEISNSSLERAQKAAESALDIARSANRAKTAFLSNMSHDIRTPLNAIIGFEKLLEHDADNPAKVREYAGKIAVSSQHLLGLINDILDMSRIESGKTTLNYESFVLGDMLAQLETVIAPQAAAKHQSLETDTDRVAGYYIRADRLRLNQILINLLSNAVKYTLDGGRILLRAEPEAQPEGGRVTLRFIIRDNGVGMSKDFQERIYEPFVREQNSTMSGIQGTGLGMSITKNLVDLMGGIITIDSELGKGSTFTVELTFALGEERPQGASAEGASAEGASALNDVLSGKHFLIAEDNSLNAEIISSLLELENATCDIVSDGRQAVDTFAACAPHTYDAVLLDIQMPVMDGYEAARGIRRCGHPEAATIPIAAMTANAFADDVQKALDAGMNAHISKPIDMEKLREFMRCV